MEPTIQNLSVEQSPNALRIVVPSKKIQINTFDHELLKDFHSLENQIGEVTSIKIEGNSYSKEFCAELGNRLQKAAKLQDLNINDIFVARKSDEIPQSIRSISLSLKGINLKRIDFSNNAVNLHGAKQFLEYLEQASTLEVLLIANCGLGPLGAAEIAQGFKGTPNLRIFSIARNRLTDDGINHISNVLHHVPKLEELFIYQNTLKEQSLTPLFNKLRDHCKNLRSFDLCDNFIRGKATVQMSLLIKQNLNLRNLNLSDCLVKSQNAAIIEALEQTTNRKFERLGFNYIELTNKLALRLLKVLVQCPIKKVDLLGNDLNEQVQEEYNQQLKGLVSKFEEDEDEEEEVLRLFEQLKI